MAYARRYKRRRRMPKKTTSRRGRRLSNRGRYRVRRGRYRRRPQRLTQNRFRTQPSDHAYAKLTISDLNFQLLQATTAGTPTSSFIRGNILLDPFVLTAGDSRPPGYDILWNQYRSYICYGSKVTCTFYNADPTANNIVYIFPQNGNHSITPQLNSKELGTIPFIRYKMVGPQSGMNCKTISTYMSMHKFFGIDWGLDKNSCQVNPSETAPTDPNQFEPSLKVIWNVGHLNPFNPDYANPTAGQVATPRCSIRVTYYTKWFSRKIQDV